MKNAVQYKGLWLMKASAAHELWEAWQKETKERNKAQSKLDSHLKEIENKYKQLIV